MDLESFKKVLGYFKQEKEKEKKENEKKEDKQESLWDFIKNKKYDRDDIQKIVSVSNSLDEIKNNFKSLDDTVKIDQCKICQQENKPSFWNLFTGIKNSISKIFSLFQKNDKNNINVEKNIDETSLEFIAEALDKDGDEGENARIMFYTMSKNMGSEKMKQLWTKVEEYMKNKKGNHEKPKQKEEEINTNTK